MSNNCQYATTVFGKRGSKRTFPIQVRRSIYVLFSKFNCPTTIIIPYWSIMRVFVCIRAFICSYGRYSAIVERVPESLRSTVALKAFYEELGFDIYSSVMVPDLYALESIITRRNLTAERLQKVTNAIHNGLTKVSRGWWDVCGVNAVDEFERLREKLEKLTDEANIERTAAKKAIEDLDTLDTNIMSRVKEKISGAWNKPQDLFFLDSYQKGKNTEEIMPRDSGDDSEVSAALIAKDLAKEQLFALTFGFRTALKTTQEITSGVLRLTLGQLVGSTAFITFNSLLDATTACQVLMMQHAKTCINSPAPEPQDVIWRNIAKPLRQVEHRRQLANIAFIVLAIFWALPVTFVQAISSISQLQVYIPVLRKLDATSIWYSLLSSYLPVLALLGLIVILPIIFKTSCFYYEGVKLSSTIQHSILQRCFLFALVNIFVTVTSGSVFQALQSIISDPKQLPSILGRSFPNVSVYMVNLVVVKALCGLPIELSQIMPIFQGLASRRSRAIAFPYGERYSAMLFVLMIAMLYSVIAPMVSFVAALFFSIALCTYKFLLLRCYHTPYEGGANTWSIIYKRVLISMVCGQLTLAGYCGLRSGYKQFPFLLFLPIITYFSYRYNDDRYTAPPLRISRELARELDKVMDQEGREIAKEFHAEAYAPPCLVNPIEEIIVDELEVKPGGDGGHYMRLDA